MSLHHPGRGDRDAATTTREGIISASHICERLCAIISSFFHFIVINYPQLVLPQSLPALSMSTPQASPPEG